VDTDGVPAAMAVTLFANADMLELLLARGADPNRTGPGGATALMWAVPDVEKMRRLISHGANVNARSDTDRTALLVAASYPGTVTHIQLLLDRGADLRAEDRGGSTALSLAIRSASVDVVRFLVDKGLDPKAISPLALRPGLARYDLPTVDYLMVNVATTPGPDVIGAAATWQPADRVARWIERGANVNAGASVAQYARTALMNAVASEAEGADTVRLLLNCSSESP
jgi:ankyrin repeat protein